MDKYDKAVALLTDHEDELMDAWSDPDVHPAGCLFAFVTDDGTAKYRPDGQACGCLSMVRSIYMPQPACTDDLTTRIRADNRIPREPEHITVESLPVFAEWQRRLDVELERS